MMSRDADLDQEETRRAKADGARQTHHNDKAATPPDNSNNNAHARKKGSSRF